MCGALGKVLCLGKEMFPKQAFALSRVTAASESPICAVGSTLQSCKRHYRSQPTHGIGRFRHLLPPETSKKRRDRMRMKEISAGSDHEYGDLNIQMTAYDMCLVEHFAQYIHKLCNRFSIRVNERKETGPVTQTASADLSQSLFPYICCVDGSLLIAPHLETSYAMPTKTMEVMVVQEQGSKMNLDAVLTTHQRVVQISGLSSTFAPILLEVLRSNQPEGVHLSVKEHTEADFKVRLKARPELEELMAQVGNPGSN